MKKQFILGFVSGAVAFGTVGVLAGNYMATDNPFPVKLNGTDVSIEGYNIEGSTYFKLRDIADVVGGFDVGFNNNTIQLSKDGYVYDTTPQGITLTDDILATITDYSLRFPTFDQNDIKTSKFADEWMWGMYKGIQTDQSKREPGELLYGWNKAEVEAKYAEIFGVNMPTADRFADGSYYWIPARDLGAAWHEVKTTESDGNGGYYIYLNIKIDDGVVIGINKCHIEPADNANGYILTSIAREQSK